MTLCARPWPFSLIFFANICPDLSVAPHKKVPFKGGSKARAALVSQSVESVFGGNNTIAGFEDTLRPLATAGAERDPTMKDLPTFKEQGMDGADFTGLYCVFAPKGVSDEVKTKWAAAIEHIAGLKGFQKFMKKNNLGTTAGTPPEPETAGRSCCFSQKSRIPRERLCCGSQPQGQPSRQANGATSAG